MGTPQSLAAASCPRRPLCPQKRREVGAMSGFLERWATQDGSSVADARTADKPCVKDEAITSPATASPGPVGRTGPSSFESARKGTADPDQRRVTSSAPPGD